jgi:hypothetical protein
VESSPAKPLQAMVSWFHGWATRGWMSDAGNCEPMNPIELHPYKLKIQKAIP